MARRRTQGRPPWQVLGLPRARSAAQVQGWRYVVLEEIVDDVALLRRWSWPLADEHGHLVWPQEHQQDATTITLSLLRNQLYAPNGLQREPRIGDTFAVLPDDTQATQVGTRRWPVHTRDLARALAGHVFDVSAEARLAARLAYQGSLAAVLPAPLPAPSPPAGQSSAPAAPPRRYRAPELRLAPPPGHTRSSSR